MLVWTAEVVTNVIRTRISDPLLGHFVLKFTYNAPKTWNDLPDDVRSATPLHLFREKLKAYLLFPVSLHDADPFYVSD